MIIPTTKEELEMLFETMHMDCEPEGTGCDLEPLLLLIKDSQIIREVCQLLSHLPHDANPEFRIALAICYGVKVGYQIKNPEMVKARD